MTFVQEVNSALGLSNLTDDPDLKRITEEQGVACTDNVTDVATIALQKYLKMHPGGNDSIAIDSEDFLRWANNGYAPYIQARQKCQLATNAYDKKITDLFGADAGVFAAALNNIQPLIGVQGQVNVPGVTMPLSDTGIDSKAGNLAPLYSFPSLNGTIQAWRSGGQSPTYGKTITTETVTSQSQSDSAEAHVSVNGPFVGGSAGGSGTSNTSLTTISGLSVVVKFGGIQLMNVYRGIWFDQFRSATALKTSDKTDEKYTAAKKVFDHYFGTSSVPGSAAVYNDKALVVYQPYVNITFATESDFNTAQSNSASASVSGFFGMVDAGATQSHTEGQAKFEKDTLSMVYQDQSPTAYILGYVQSSFWQAP